LNPDLAYIIHSS